MSIDKHNAIMTSTLLFRELLYPRSVAYVNRITQSLASGTLVTIGDRLFVATVAHAIPDDAKGLWIFGVGTSIYLTDPAKDYPGLLKCGKAVDGEPDVGYIELDAAIALPDLHLKSWTIDRLATLGCGREGYPVLLVGNPAEHGKFTPETKHAPARWDVANVFYLTTPLMQADWPTAIQEPGDAGIDIFLKYPDTEANDMVSGRTMSLPHPGGMSGGGIWDQGFEKGVMWSPDSARLFAIQSSWYERSRYVRGVQVIHWLRLIHRDYADLRILLESQFAALY